MTNDYMASVSLLKMDVGVESVRSTVFGFKLRNLSVLIQIPFPWKLEVYCFH